MPIKKHARSSLNGRRRILVASPMLPTFFLRLDCIHVCAYYVGHIITLGCHAHVLAFGDHLLSLVKRLASETITQIGYLLY